MQWALLSVWEKRGVVELGRVLARHGIQILSSGGTGKTLAAAGVPFTEVAAYTGAPEMMDGRVKTLHPRIHGGLLGRRGIDDAVMEAHGIQGIDLLVVNLYPFEQMAGQGLDLEHLVEFIDIGGPAMIRAAAKNYRNVAVVVDPGEYPAVLRAVESGGFTPEERLRLAKKAFACTAAYDAAISNHLHALGSRFPDVYTVQFRNGRPLRYGENPHQQGEVYGEAGIAGLAPLQGKEMSYNNYLDLSAAVGLLREFDECAAVCVKHNNPCGVAVGGELHRTYVEAREADPVSAYGGIVALNREVDADTAGEICATFIEVVIAPSHTAAALTAMRRKENMRVLTLPAPSQGPEIRTIDGGALLQRTPAFKEHWKVVTERDPTAGELEALRLAWKVCTHTRSNAIVYADRTRTLGIGAGQTSRVDAARIAVQKARHPLKGSAVASDGFLPFPDTLEEAAAAGATALVQPGGSIRDAEVIAAANRLDVAMIFTGTRHFRH
ncbi:MAG: bifunctional phosphoribosylaminoimidazolecarboxamide formyltransferase/IMP cyclohydrolase [Methanomicrobiales archaeon]|nr:bifunctional phosphoribosylaminoimidazolecarboxamide formyltransferase/IMP cyclohydrolase [Methanomicrobiales archaeon]